jgi:hypothetical protein
MGLVAEFIYPPFSRLVNVAAAAEDRQINGFDGNISRVMAFSNPSPYNE